MQQTYILSSENVAPVKADLPLTHIKCISVAAPSLCQDSG